MGRMKNAEIVMIEWAQLVMDGTIQEDEHLRTYAVWKKLGFQVRKGETAVAKFPIWNYSKRKPKEEDGEVEQVKGGYFYLKNTAFFCDRQVDPIEEKTS